MSYLDNMVERFDAGTCVIGFLVSGTIVVDCYAPTAGKYYPFADAIAAIANPSRFSAMLGLAKSGNQSAIGYYEGVNVAGLEIGDGVLIAELDLPNDTYTDQMTFAEFDPILEAWQKAWAAAQVYRARLETK